MAAWGATVACINAETKKNVTARKARRPFRLASVLPVFAAEVDIVAAEILFFL
jgi:hypothetical protein